MRFSKMHGLGNDYICVDCFRQTIELTSQETKELCDRHYGIGADGLILVRPSACADFKMEIYNADGSLAKMCGNGLRCAARFAYEKDLCRKTRQTVETASGRRRAELFLENGTVGQIRADMGVPCYNAHSIPVLCERDTVVNEPIQVRGEEYRMTAVSMGNPHAVIFTGEPEQIPLDRIGPLLEFHPRFPERVNVEFCKVEDRNTLRVRVWERGAGETLACGTGACAVLVAAVLNEQAEEKARIRLPGGILEAEWNRAENHVYLTGSAEKVFEGIWERKRNNKISEKKG